MRCEQADQSAPRVGCDCRECYLARERYVDPRLFEIVGVRHQFHDRSDGPARDLVRRGIELYLMGKIEWAALQSMIIEELVKLADDQFKRELDRTRLELPPRFIANPNGDWMLGDVPLVTRGKG